MGTRPFGGLITLMRMVNNWDLMDRNNVIYEFKEPRGGRPPLVRGQGPGGRRSARPRHWASGRQGSKNDVEDFEKQDFIKGVEGERWSSTMRGCRHRELYQDVTVADVRWICERLARLTPAQWKDAFRAARYPDDVADRFIRKLQEKIAYGLSLPRATPAPSARPARTEDAAAAPGIIRARMRPLRIALVGFGNVGRRFAALLGGDYGRVLRAAGVRPRITGIATARHGVGHRPARPRPARASRWSAPAARWTRCTTGRPSASRRRLHPPRPGRRAGRADAARPAARPARHLARARWPCAAACTWSPPTRAPWRSPCARCRPWPAGSGASSSTRAWSWTGRPCSTWRERCLPGAQSPGLPRHAQQHDQPHTRPRMEEGRSAGGGPARGAGRWASRRPTPASTSRAGTRR